MEDFLRTICINNEIELMYTNNQKPILSSCLDFEGTRVITANNIFRNCSRNVAMAIVDYYENEKNKSESLNKIKDYLNTIFKDGSYMIDGITIDIKDEPKKEMKEVEKIEKAEDKKNKSLMELEIESIVPRSFREKGSGVKDMTMKVDNDDVLELDIYVNPFDT